MGKIFSDMSRVPTGFDREATDILQSVLNVKIALPLGSDYYPNHPQEMGDWFAFESKDAKKHPLGRWASLATNFLTQSQIIEMRKELLDRVNVILGGMDKEGHEFFPSLIGKGYYKNEEEIAISLDALHFLDERGIKIDISDILAKYRGLEVQRVKEMQELEDRINKLSGFPVWENFAHASHPSNKPFVHMQTPGGIKAGEKFDRWNLTSNHGTEIEAFIKNHGLNDVMRYEIRPDRDGPTTSVIHIEAKNPAALRAVIEKLEGEYKEDFQTLMKDMLLKALPIEIMQGLSYAPLLRSLKQMGSGTLGELEERVRAQPESPALRATNEIISNSPSMRDAIIGMAQLEAKETDETVRPIFADTFARLKLQIPALAEYIDEQRAVSALPALPLAEGFSNESFKRGQPALRHPLKPDGTTHGKA